jgi:2-oxoglutarate ferredoxin oxidoreductase subunit gamma
VLLFAIIDAKERGIMSRFEIKICGFGGQGIVTLGRVITFAAYISGKHAAETIAYGAESRGGSSWADVVIDDEEVDYPRVSSPDMLILFSQEGAIRFGKSIKDKGVVFYGPVTVTEPNTKETASVFSIPATTIAREELKAGMVANSVMFGAFIKIAGLIHEESARRSLESIVPKEALELNIQAFQRGVEVAAELLKV